jgi:chromate transporter
MNFFVLYFIFLKATISSFSGLSALPILRDELVVNRHALSDDEMNTALVAGRISPGPIGMYVVSVGYYVAGFPGTVAAWLALVTPAVVIVPLLRYVGARAERPVVRQAIDAVVLASVGLTLATVIPMAAAGIDDVWTGTAAMAGAGFLLYRNRQRAA